jgi:molecular chaperone DnaK (HSP70)
LLNEPTAASFAYLYNNKVLYEDKFDKKILVIDFGAGTLDLTILDICKDDELVCEVLGIYGDNNFGGIDITQLIYNTLFNDSFISIDINTKLKIAEDIKIQLSSQLDVKYFSNELTHTFYYNYNTFCSQLNNLFEQKILYTIEQVLLIAKLDKYNIDEIILVGGSFKIPYFRSLVSNYFNKEINKVSLKVDNQTFLLYEEEIIFDDFDIFSLNYC